MQDEYLAERLDNWARRVASRLMDSRLGRLTCIPLSVVFCLVGLPLILLLWIAEWVWCGNRS